MAFRVDHTRIASICDGTRKMAGPAAELVQRKSTNCRVWGPKVKD